MVSSVIGGLATSAVGALGSSLFGGSSSSSVNPNAGIPRLNAGGLTFRGGKLKEVSPERLGAVSGLQATFPEQAELIKGLRESVTPGFGRLTQARVDAINTARQRAIGNLRENLSRRRVLGSSFGQDAVLRGEAEFAQQEELARAESFLQELALTKEILGAEYEARRGEFQTLLDEYNIQLDAAVKLASGAAAEAGATARANAQIAAKGVAGAGAALEPFASKIGSTASDIFTALTQKNPWI